MTLIEEIGKSQNLDEIIAAQVDDELERELKQLNDQVEKLKKNRIGEKPRHLG